MKATTLDRRVTPKLEKGIKKLGQAALDRIGSPAKFDIKNPLVDDYLDAWRGQRITGVTDRTRQQVSNLLTQALNEGVGVKEMARRLKKKFKGWTSTKAMTVARTEAVGSANAANVAAYQLSGLVEGKEWLAVPGKDTRDTHRELDGVRVGVRELFVTINGGGQGPGLFGIAAEDCNCRCGIIPVMNDDALTTEQRELLWKAWDESLVVFENDVHAGMVACLNEWLADVLAAM